MKKPSREEYTERGAALGVDETYKYVEALEGLYLCIDVLTDKESKKDKEYWKKKVMKDD